LDVEEMLPGPSFLVAVFFLTRWERGGPPPSGEDSEAFVAKKKTFLSIRIGELKRVFLMMISPFPLREE